VNTYIAHYHFEEISSAHDFGPSISSKSSQWMDSLSCKNCGQAETPAKCLTARILDMVNIGRAAVHVNYLQLTWRQHVLDLVSCALVRSERLRGKCPLSKFWPIWKKSYCHKILNTKFGA